ncbi:MAG: hypothetical protein ACAI34_24195 [Verrucomicrobium sp.]
MLFFRSDRLYEAAAQSPEKAAALLVRLRKARRSAFICGAGLGLLGLGGIIPVMFILSNALSPVPSPCLEWCLAHYPLILMVAGGLTMAMYLQVMMCLNLDSVVKVMILFESKPKELERVTSSAAES